MNACVKCTLESPEDEKHCFCPECIGEIDYYSRPLMDFAYGIRQAARGLEKMNAEEKEEAGTWSKTHDVIIGISKYVK